ncbi:radical SAM protein [Candidatus Beckwithbacteria bacterium]|nr:radical SAM protein [Candidatus Beckwithbacteria bacterium]
MEIQEIEAKSVLTKSKLPDCDYVVNPYTGCGFACKYCYASFMCRFVDRDIQDWGKFVYVKTNAPKLLASELGKLKQKGKGVSIFFSSVTDPYQGVEAKHQLTRQCLEVLADFQFVGLVSILSKSDLVLRDIDVFKKLKNVEIGLTITSTDDGISRYFETNAPAASKRLQAIKSLQEAGLKTYVFVGPVLPHFVGKPQVLEHLFKRIAETGNQDVYVEQINLKPYILERLKKEMKDLDPNIWQEFYQSRSKNYQKQLDSLVKNLVKKYDLHLRLNQTITH